MSTDRRAGVDAASKGLRLLAAVGVFCAVGPPIGGLVTWVTMGASALRSPIPFVTGSYAEGVALALLAGLLVGLAALWLGRAPWFVPVVVAVIVMMAMLATTASATPGIDLVTAMLRVGRVFFPASLIATVACWLLTRRLLRFE
jgi:thiamine transporter ThiT